SLHEVRSCAVRCERALDPPQNRASHTIGRERVDVGGSRLHHSDGDIRVHQLDLDLRAAVLFRNQFRLKLSYQVEQALWKSKPRWEQRWAVGQEACIARSGFARHRVLET